MKKLTFLLLCGVFCLALLPKESHAVTINIYGKAGAYFQNGKWKVCPGFRFNKCATLTITWKEIRDFIYGNEEAPSAVVDVYTEEGLLDYTINVKVIEINPSAISGETPPEYIMGDDIVFAPN